MKILIKLDYNDDGNFFKILHIGSQEECESLKQKLDLELKESKIKWEKAREVQNKKFEINRNLIEFLRLISPIEKWEEFPEISNLLMGQKTFLEKEVQDKMNLFSQEEKDLLNLIDNERSPDYTAYVIAENGKSYPSEYYHYEEYYND